MNLRTNGGLETVITINPEDPKDPNQKNIPFSEGEIDKEIPIFLGKKQENNTFPDSINVI
jgi:type I restriction-modification system DNA methylase subunit